MSSGAGVWQPKKPVDITVEKLTHFAALIGDDDVVNLADLMTADEIAGDAILMKQGEGAWSAAQLLSTEDLVRLIRFFTLAEMQLSGWDGGKQSPVIALVRLLKARGEFDSTLRVWIKRNSDNRFLPYGSAL